MHVLFAISAMWLIQSYLSNIVFPTELLLVRSLAVITILVGKDENVNTQPKFFNAAGALVGVLAFCFDYNSFYLLAGRARWTGSLHRSNN